MIPPKERCEQVLKEPNRDVTPWTCPVCHKNGSRAHWIAEHVLEHLRRGETQPWRPAEAEPPLKAGVRPLDLD